jgi:hypothetical protein
MIYGVRGSLVGPLVTSAYVKLTGNAQEPRAMTFPVLNNNALADLVGPTFVLGSIEPWILERLTALGRVVLDWDETLIRLNQSRFQFLHLCG